MASFYVARAADQHTHIRNVIGHGQTLVVHDVASREAGVAMIPGIAANPVAALGATQGTVVRREFEPYAEYQLDQATRYDSQGHPVPVAGGWQPPRTVQELLAMHLGGVVVLLCYR